MTPRRDPVRLLLRRIPMVGHLLRILRGIWLLPQIRKSVNDMRAAQRRHLKHVRTLTKTVDRLKALQEAQARDVKNLARSVPVAIRGLTRDVESVKGQLGGTLVRLDRQEELEQSVERLEGRIEFVRREVLFEQRYGTDGHRRPLDTTPEIVDKAKLDAARAAELKVNLGCGHAALDGYVNVDRRALPGVDIVADAEKLPLNEGEVAEIFSAHLLEHFPQEYLRRTVLPYWRSLLRPGGVLRGVVPDADAMMTAYVAGAMTYEDLREVTFGAQDYEGDAHANMFTPDHLAGLLTEAGFTDVTWTARGRRNGACLEMEFVAVSP